MNNTELIKRLRAEGWQHVGGKGDHAKYMHPDKAGHVVVPHPRKDIAIAHYEIFSGKLAGIGE